MVFKSSSMTKKIIFSLLSLYCLLQINIVFGNNLKKPEQKPKTIVFRFILAQSAITSAGVYTTNGVLIKTLWSGIRYSKGVHDTSWDATDDEGNFVDFGNYSIKVLSNNVTYTWEGVVGNTSTAIAGTHVHTSYSAMNGITICEKYAYYSMGYPEQHASQAKFNLATPNIKELIDLPASGSGQWTLFLDNDGKNVYYAGFDAFSTNAATWFVFASRIIANDQYVFPNGSPYKTAWNTSYKSVIDRLNDVNGTITGLAVQKSSNLLFVAHRNLNLIKVFDKNSGAMISNLTFVSPETLTTDFDNNLWIRSGKIIAKYNVSKNGAISPSGITISGLESPLAMAISPDNSKLVVIDGGVSQQVKAFNTLNGSAVWVLGQAGGYSTSPVIASDKFYFSDERDSATRFGPSSYIAFQPDGSFWVGDTYNYRIQHFSPSRNFLNTVMFLPHFRCVGIDGNNPHRVFADYLEFKIDYTKTLSPDNGSWTAVNNWRYKITNEYDGEFNRLKSPTTYTNGRTYALQWNHEADQYEIVELAITGIRYTGITSPKYTLITTNGNLRRISVRSIGNPSSIYEKALTGFDANNNPTFADEVRLVATPDITVNDPVTIGVVGWEGYVLNPTDSGYYITYEGGSPNYSNASNKWHLGAIKNNLWVFKTAKGTYPNYNGPYPSDGRYDVGNTVQYPGGPVLVKENNIFWGYHGEFWKQTQTNKWQHVYGDGLLVGVFGVTGIDFGGNGAVSPAQMAGNVLTAGIVKIEKDYYLYHCDESYHGGVHRWKISNLNTIQEQIIPVRLLTEK
jgi:hypothetical protein